MVGTFSKKYNIGLSVTGKVDVMANTPNWKTYYCSILFEEVEVEEMLTNAQLNCWELLEMRYQKMKEQATKFEDCSKCNNKWGISGKCSV